VEPKNSRQTVIQRVSVFLGVQASVTGKQWRARLDDERVALAISQGYELAEVLGRVVAARAAGSTQSVLRQRILLPLLNRQLAARQAIGPSNQTVHVQIP